MHSLNGIIIGNRYKIEKPLSDNGGMATVYLGSLKIIHV